MRNLDGTGLKRLHRDWRRRADADPLHEATFPDRTCLALGHEDRGLSDAVLEACDTVVFIPQLGKVGSLNVATACGIALYEVHRRLW